MGADIHAVIEYDTGNDFCQPEGLAFLEWPRHSELFLALGVYRSIQHCRVPVRGFPSHCSYLAESQYALYVCADNAASEYPDQRVICESDALAEVMAGNAHFLENSLFQPSISHPGFSCPNWITLAEFDLTCELFLQSPRSVSLECLATLCLMRQMKDQDVKTRLVYWFDV